MVVAASHMGALSRDERHLLESWLVEFDLNWNRERLATQTARLPAPGNPLRQAALIELVKIDLERQWQGGARPRVEDYLISYPELAAHDFVIAELVPVELGVRQQFGAAPAWTEYLERFPAHAEIVRQLADAPSPGNDVYDRILPVRAPALDRVPESFGRYRLQKLLGKGAMGAVYLANDPHLDRLVALKVPHWQISDDPALLQRFLSEARSAATLRHPNLCPVYDVGQQEGLPYLTMAYIEGRSLAECLRHGERWPSDRAARLIQKLALALAEAHAVGIVHRDLKPANIMIDRRGEPVIMDFGLARRINTADPRLTNPSTLVGTPLYMAPEQASGGRTPGPGCDIYSLGVIFYELLAGRLPFEGAVLEVLIQAQLNDPKPPSTFRPGLNPALEAICLKAMARNIADRYASMTDLASALEEYTRTAASADAHQRLPTPGAEMRQGEDQEAAHSSAWSTIVDRTGQSVTKTDSDSAMTMNADRPDGASTARLHRRADISRRRRLGGVIAVVGALALLAAAAVIRVNTGHGEFVVETDDPDVAVLLNQKGGITIHDRKTDRQFTLKPGKHDLPTGNYEIEVTDELTHLAFNALVFTIKRGETATAKVWFDKPRAARPGAVQAILERDGVPKKPLDKDWLKEVAQLAAEQQVKAVADKLREHNPRFDSKVEHVIAKGIVVEIRCSAEGLHDLTPLRALTGLQVLLLASQQPSKQLSDLSPLKGLPITCLAIVNCAVKDLSPLAGMPLTILECLGCPIKDLSPLAGMPLSYFNAEHTAITDIAVLKGMPLKILRIRSTRVVDLSPLVGMPLKELSCSFRPERDTEILQGLATLQKVNDKPVADFWKSVLKPLDPGWAAQVGGLPPEKQVDAVAAKLKERNPGFDGKLEHIVEGGVVVEVRFDADQVSDLAPLRALTGLRSLLTAKPGKLFDDLSPLKGLPLCNLSIGNSLVHDLSPLAGMPLTSLECFTCPISDLTTLKGLSLSFLNCHHTTVSDVAVLKDMPLRYLNISYTKVADLSPLRGMRLEELWCDLESKSDVELVASIKTLRKVNGRPIEDLRKEASAGAVSADVQKLLAELRSADRQIRKQAAESLGKLKDTSAVPALMARVADERCDNEQAEDKNAALVALKALAPQRSFEALLQALKSANPDVRVWAILRLSDSREPQLGPPKPEKDRPIVDALCLALEDNDWHVRKTAALMLLGLGHKSAVEPLVKRLADDRFDARWPQDKETALSVLVTLAPERVTAALLDTLRSQNGPVRGWAASQYFFTKQIKRTPPEWIDALIAALADKEWHVRAMAADSLRRLEAHKAIPALVQRVQDEHIQAENASSDKDMALASLKALAPDQVKIALTQALKSPEPRVRAWASARLASQP